MNDPAGRLQIHLHRQPEGLAVTIHSSRLTGASRVFIGKDLTTTVRTLPSLFSVCATAQAVACVTAGEAALGIRPHPRALAARLLLVDLETMREHLWRLLLDWPRFLGAGPRGAAMAQVMGTCDQVRRALAANGDPLLPGAADLQPDAAAAAGALMALTAITVREVLGQPPGDWLATTTNHQALRHWARTSDTPAARLIDLVNCQGWAGLGRSPVVVLPPLTLAELDARLSGPGAEAFIAAPLWEGAAAESTPFARQLNQPLVADLDRELGNGLLPRLAAQLVELAALLVELPRRLAALANGAHPDAPPDDHPRYPPDDHPDNRPDDYPDNPCDDPVLGAAIQSHAGWRDLLAEGRMPAGTGLAQVQAARGLLVHRLTLELGRLTDYRILAPTEWNFHPQGAAALGLATLPATNDATLHRLAGLFITALDPCVAYDISIS